MNVVPMTPITKVSILRNVRLDSSYKDTFDFSDVSAQTAFFQSKAKYNFTDFTPVRLQNAIRVPVAADNLYDCSYLMFQNANFGNKWFYAFIKEIKFINVNMSEILFDIDVIQTWWFDITLNQSYIVREHSATDNIGDNLVLEDVELGEYINETAQRSGHTESYVAVIATAYDADGTPGGYFGGTFTGLNYVAGLIDNSEQVQQLLSFLQSAVDANKADSITSTFIMPFDFYTTDSMPITHRVDVEKQLSKVGTYTPKNKKLLTYPYNYLMVSTSDGAQHSYRYEYFQGSVCGFILECAMGCNPEIVLEPIAYNNQQFNVEESLSLSGFPQFGFSIDTFRAWLAQNSNSTFLAGITNVLSIAGGALTANPMAVAGGVIGLSSTVNNVVMAANKADSSRGAQGSNTLVGTREKDFYFYPRHIREDYAQILDDYFTMYGYATHTVKSPNIKTRTSWNYVQTRNAKITGNVPFEDITVIKDCFNNGITFWHGDWIGDYSRDNSPL